MFDFGFGEIVLILMVALVVLGPERLPKTARTIGQWVGKVRYYVGSVKNDLSQHLDAAELQSLQDTANAVRQEINALQASAAHLTALNNLPEQKTPADFVSQYTAPEKKLKRQSTQTIRQKRTKLPPKPRLRGSRRHIQH